MNWPHWVRATARAAEGRSRKPTTSWQQLICILDANRTELVLDVGANHGQYAKGLRRHGYVGAIRSFEPLPDLHAELVEMASHDKAWTIDLPFVIGAQNQKVQFHRSAEDDMSSVLGPSALQEIISPSSRMVETVETQERRLDSLIDRLDRPTHLKLDVQGYENAVLTGMGDLLGQCSSVQLEMSLQALYEGECHWREMTDRLEAAGFELALVIPGYFERKIARQLQIDGVFVNRNTGRLQANSLSR